MAHRKRGLVPDYGAVRVIFEETGLIVELVGGRHEDVSDPVELHHTAGCSWRTSGRGISIQPDLYFARPIGFTETSQSYG